MVVPSVANIGSVIITLPFDNYYYDLLFNINHYSKFTTKLLACKTMLLAKRKFTIKTFLINIFKEESDYFELGKM